LSEQVYPLGQIEGQQGGGRLDELQAAKKNGRALARPMLQSDSNRSSSVCLFATFVGSFFSLVASFFGGFSGFLSGFSSLFGSLFSSFLDLFGAFFDLFFGLFSSLFGLLSGAFFFLSALFGSSFLFATFGFFTFLAIAGRNGEHCDKYDYEQTCHDIPLE
jgi:hypothetical protein